MHIPSVPPQHEFGLPKFIEDLTLHMFPFPPIVARPVSKALYAYFSTVGSWIIDKAEKMGMSRDEACHNLIFAWIANAFLDVNIYLPRLFKWVAAVGPELHRRLAGEARSVIAADEGHVTVSGLEKMELVVDCSKITEDKSSESRVQTPDARLIIATSAVPRRRA